MHNGVCCKTAEADKAILQIYNATKAALAEQQNI